MIAEFSSKYQDKLPQGETCKTCNHNQVKRLIFSSDKQAQTGRYGVYICARCGTEIKEIFDPGIYWNFPRQSRYISKFLKKYWNRLNQDEINFLIDMQFVYQPNDSQKLKTNSILQKCTFDGFYLFHVDEKIPANSG